jgi:hypothetical protein
MLPLPEAPTWQESTLASIARAARRKVVCRATIRFAGPPTIILAGFAERGRTIWEAILA